ncbi:MAG: FxSxx-COOH system tetratricopeptide repeat protein [Elainellaceae cyanobacterium]
MVPLEPNPCFTGRESVLRQIRQRLNNDRRVGVSQVQAIAGLGGIGKTQTAFEYASRYYWEADEADAYQAVFWIRVDTEQAIQSGYEAIAEVLKLPQADAKEPDVVVQAVKAWLSQHSGWLLVLDNADDPSFIPPYLPKQGNGHVLITSRVQDLQPLGIIKNQILALDALDPEESLDFLLKRTEQAAPLLPEEKTAAEALCHELGHLPLALEQAGAYMVTTNARFQDYLTSYRHRRDTLLNESAPILGEYREPIATTWNINFEAVEAESLAAADLLRASAFLHPDSIPFDLMVSGAELWGDAIQQALANANEDPLAFINLLTPLRRYSLVRSEPGQTYSVHRLVQAVVKTNLGEEAAKQWAERVVRVVTQAYPNADDYNNWAECERLLLHAQAATADIQTYQFEFYEAGTLLIRLGFYFKERGQYAETEPCYEKGVDICKKALGDRHPSVATSLNNLALLYESQGRYEEAEPYYLQALEMRRELLGESHPDVATSLNNLALLYYSQGRYGEAEPFYLQALEMKRELLGESHPSVATSLNNLALLYKSQGRYEEAEPYFLQALEMNRELLGDRHPDVATSLNNLAGLYDSQGRYGEAEPYYLRALEMRRELLGESHPDVASSLNNLALLYKSQGRYGEAEPYYQQALEMRRSLLGDSPSETLRERHPDVATSLNDLAGLYRSQGRYEEAEPYFLQALEMRRELLGDRHPHVAASLNNLAGLYRSQGRYEAAEPFYREAIAIGLQTLGDDHPDIAIWFSNLAGLYTATGRFAEAQPLYLQTLAIFVQRLGQEHPYVNQAIGNLLSFVQAVIAAGQEEILSDAPLIQAIVAQVKGEGNAAE